MVQVYIFKPNFIPIIHNITISDIVSVRFKTDKQTSNKVTILPGNLGLSRTNQTISSSTNQNTAFQFILLAGHALVIDLTVNTHHSTNIKFLVLLSRKSSSADSNG